MEAPLQNTLSLAQASRVGRSARAVARRARNLRSEGGEKLQISRHLSGRIESGASERTCFGGSGLALGDGRSREKLDALAKRSAIVAPDFPAGAIGPERFSDALN
jgi:hypothetical protein